jgi:nitrate/nitrite transporter NarK
LVSAGSAGSAVSPAAFAASTAQTVVIAALPVFAREFGVSGAAAPWALTAFMLASAVATPIAGRLGDLFGYRRIALVCLGIFVVVRFTGWPSPSSARSWAMPWRRSRRAWPRVSTRSPGPAGGAVGAQLAAVLVVAGGTGAAFWVFALIAALALAVSGALPGRTPAAAVGTDRVSRR